MNEKGRLLVTTKAGSTGRKTLVCILCPLLILFGIKLISVSEPTVYYKITHSNYEFHQIFIILVGVALIMYAVYAFAVVFIGNRSYCEVYEHSVTGMTALVVTPPMQKFDIDYHEINNVTETGKMICIYTPYTKYEVLALRNREEAIREIRKRMGGNTK